MTTGMKRNIKITIDPGQSVSGIVQIPDDAWCLMVLAHGAGANMQHAFMQGIADRLAQAGIGTLRFNFLYMEQGGGRPDLPHVAYSVLRAATARALEYAAEHAIPVVGAGKSFGGRMFSQLMAAGEDVPAIRALVFFGYPLHAPGKPGIERAAHLSEVKVPMLFLQGTRDTLAQIDMMRDVTKSLRKATLEVFEDADHGFHVPKRSGKTDDQVLDACIDTVARWLRKRIG